MANSNKNKEENKIQKELITFKEIPDSENYVKKLLYPLVRQWFFNRFPSFSKPQLFGVSEVHNRNNILVSAPTGATKTLTSFLAVLNELVDSAEKGILEDKIYAVYISPLKALNNDIQKNLLEPLAEIEEIAGKKLGIRIGVRTGDTTPYEKSKMLKNPPHILITTPESLAIVLSSIKFKNHLSNVDWCIIDEIHALAENKRGVHLSLSLERLEHTAQHMTRVGLSATVAPIKEIAKFLVGNSRPCKIIDVQFTKNYDFKVLSPVPNLMQTTHENKNRKLYKLLNNLILEHKTTLIFTNTRAATERIVDNLKEKFPKSYDGSNIGAHHGSLSKAHRTKIENNLRSGKLKCVVCSTSLELGIDIGFIDLVICLSSPKSVARYLQRVGRSGHKLHQTVKGRIIVMNRDDLVECSVLLKSAIEKKIDRIHIPTNALDVLAQQIIGMAIEKIWDEEELFRTIKKSYCYHKLSRKQFGEILDYLSGKFVDLEERHVYARIWRDEGKIGKRGRLARVIYMTNLGTIPDQSFITVKIGNEIIGKLDEGFTEKLKPGDVFILGGDTYQFKYSRGMVAQVSASVNRPPTVPNWVSESLPLSFDLANEIGRFRRLMFEHFNEDKSKEEILEFIYKFLYLDKNAASSIFKYFNQQYEYLRKFPSDKTIIIEYFDDGIEKKIIFHSLFGRRVNDCLSRAIAYIIGRNEHKDVEIGINDNGFYLGGDKKLNIPKAIRLLRADKLDLLMSMALEKSEVLKRRFRHCATRSFMILKNFMGRKKYVGRQQVSSMILMSAIKRIDNNFSILQEARREVLEDLMDIKNTKKIVQGIRDKTIKLVEVNTKIPSPFAFNLALMGYMDILKMEDRQEFLRRMHELVKAKIGYDSDKFESKLKSIAESEKQFTIISNTNIADIRREFIKRAQSRPKLTQTQNKLLDQLAVIRRITRDEKIEVRKMILAREKLDQDIINQLINKSETIKEHWPKTISKFVLGTAKNQFSYAEFWKQEEEKEEDKEEETQEQLFVEFKRGALKTDLDPQIQYNIIDWIKGENINPRRETRIWLKELLSGAIPKIWSDLIVKFLQKKYKEHA